MIAITGASGQLGQLVIKHLLKNTKAETIIAVVRNIEKAEHLKSLGIQIRQADYSNPETLTPAFSGVSKVLLISSSEVGQRSTQHRNVINAAKQANVQLLAYTSILHADTSPLALAEEHIDTENYLKEINMPHVLLRNSWYTENYLMSIEPSLVNGGFIGCAKEGKISSASREDYAEAAAVILASHELQAGKVYEFAGDEAYTLAELCTIISEESGKEIPYIDMEESEFATALEEAGIPKSLAAILADSDTGVSKGGLFDDSHTLSNLIGHPTQSLRKLVKAYL